MTPEELKSKLAVAFPGADISADGDGSHFLVQIISKQFDGQSSLVRQRSVYACLGDDIASGAIHALTIKARTPEE